MEQHRFFASANAPSVGGSERPLVCSTDPKTLSEPGEVTVAATIDGTAPPDSGEWSVPIGLYVNGAQVDSAVIVLDASGSETAEWDVQLSENGSYVIQVTAGDPFQ